jgi:hypothetical protein
MLILSPRAVQKVGPEQWCRIDFGPGRCPPNSLKNLNSPLLALFGDEVPIPREHLERGTVLGLSLVQMDYF